MTSWLSSPSALVHIICMIYSFDIHHLKEDTINRNITINYISGYCTYSYCYFFLCTFSTSNNIIMAYPACALCAFSYHTDTVCLLVCHQSSGIQTENSPALNGTEGCDGRGASFKAFKGSSVAETLHSSL